MSQRSRSEKPMMNGLLVLAAGASPYESRSLERMLGSAGFPVRAVTCANDACDEVSQHRGHCVLVIDSGLLEMDFDAQWRLFRASNPELGTVIRCWIERDPGIRQTQPRTFVVHPDHGDGLLDAVRKLGASPPGA
jgi:CheY-like chemotaxis protein